MKKKNNTRWYVYGIILVICLWQVWAMALHRPIIPAPWQVAGNFVQIFVPKLSVHVLYSVWRLVAGLSLAIAAGIPLGLCMGYFSQWDKVLAPVIYLIYPIPKVALLPVFMVLFGLGEESKILMIFFIVVFQVTVAVRDGVKEIPQETYYSLYSLGASKIAVFREILIPASLPKILTSLRVAMATAVSVLFFTETFGTQYGMGYFIMDAWMRVNYLEMYSGIVALSLTGLLLFGLIDYAETRLCRWL